MPSLVIPEGWIESDKIDALDVHSERFFLRLCLKADDFGCFYASTTALRSMLFPMKEDVRSTDMSRHLADCEKAGLVRCYEVAGKRYLEIINFDQRLRAKTRKFPEPTDSCHQDDGQMSDISQSIVCQTTDTRRLETKRNRNETEEERETKCADALSSPMEKVQEAWNSQSKLPKIQSFSEDRKRKLKSRLNDQFFLQNYIEAIRKIADSEFCTGNNDRGWRADFDWFIQPATIAKVIEGKYDGKPSASKTVPLRAGEEPPVWDPMED